MEFIQIGELSLMLETGVLMKKGTRSGESVEEEG